MFEELTGNQRVKDILKRMLQSRRLPGALLFTGDEGVGKKLFALELARSLNCRNKQHYEACGVCAACVRIGKITYPTDPDSDEAKQIIWSEHRDVGIVVAPKRTLRVDQMRHIEREANYRPVEGSARFFLIDQADKLNDPSSNALLKILEEPPPTSHIILITSRPTMLLPTVLSRCQAIRFSPLTAAEIGEYLVQRNLADPDVARLRAQAADGSIGRALAGDVEIFKSQRESMLKIISALATGEGKLQLLRSSEELNETQYKDQFETRLDVLERLIRDVWMLGLSEDGANHVVNSDLLPQLRKLGETIDPSRAASWLLQIEDLREQLVVNVNRKVATDALLLGMAATNCGISDVDARSKVGIGDVRSKI
ncbi:MAG: ATP-binding protein [Pyrinomonadaceae bacterium]